MIGLRITAEAVPRTAFGMEDAEVRRTCVTRAEAHEALEAVLDLMAMPKDETTERLPS